MRDRVIHQPTGIELDLALPGYGHAHGEHIVRECLGNSRKNKRVLLCGAHAQPVYLIRRPVPGNREDRAVWANHFGDGQPCSPGMSDEHKRQTEYIARAAGDAGYRTTIEAVLPNAGIKPDALVYGPTTVAVEVQRSELARHHAVARTNKAKKVGAVSVWFNDRDPLQPPAWFFHVPSVGMNKMPWDVIPRRGSATATSGLRRIMAKPCRIPHFDRCPISGRGHCHAFHPTHEPLLGFTVDDVAAMVPAGLLVPIQFRRSKRSDVLLVSPEHRDLYCELTERPGSPEVAAAQPAMDADPLERDPRRVECTNLIDGTASARRIPARRDFTVSLDWSHPRHWLPTSALCNACHRPTHLCDAAGRPMHKVCAESASTVERHTI